MKIFKLYNFDHDLSEPGCIDFEKFSIVVEKQHCLNLPKLGRNESTTFSHDEDFKKIIKRKDKVICETIETAILQIHSDNINLSELYPTYTNRLNVDDIVLLLSFFTGRKVYIEKDIKKGLSSRKYTYSRLLHTSSIRNFDFNKIRKIKEYEASAQFYNLVRAGNINDMPAMAFYGSSVLNALYDAWAKKNTLSKYNKTEKRLIDQALISAKGCVKNFLEKKSLRQGIIDG